MASRFADRRTAWVRFASAAVCVFVLALPALSAAQSSGGRAGGFGGGSRSTYRPSSHRYGSSSSSSTPTRSAAEIRREREARRYEDESYRRWREARVERGSPEPSDAERQALAAVRTFGEDSLLQGLLAFALAFVGVLIVGTLVHQAVGRVFAIRRLGVAIGGEARAEVQSRLRTIAKGGGATPGARQKLVRETLALLRTHAPHARYVLWSVERHRRGAGRTRFHALAQDLRARFKHETVGAGHRAPTYVAGGEEGEGLVVISLLVTGEPTKPLPTTLDLGAALDAFEARSPLGVELIWSPSEPEDRMSSAELETLYPELTPLSGQAGRVACRACGAIHARELGRCPACGAPHA
ncbi:MAG: DUF1517 domain-containing protein [Sandaracinus sp.]|nr:DUF1517 domain-containing protein [Sandaracinus sp.]MCB9613198.1 DUF1517 domain-containing protein [Sandaracinus sp.]